MAACVKREVSMNSAVSNKLVVGRYAPSPTGRMHLGNAFSALCAWLFARKADGLFHLRMEDLDPQRSRPEYASQLREDLKWLGLDWDGEGPAQSCRTDAYYEAFQQLVQADLVYPCFCSRKDLHAAGAPHASDGTTVYAGTCRAMTREEQQRRLKEAKPAWRLILPNREFFFRDVIQGYYTENLSRDCGDIILRRSDGVFAYQLAVTVDDMAMGVNQVVRGRDLLSSVPRQSYIRSLLGYAGQDYEYAHVPMLLSADGSRLSKRDRSFDFEKLRRYYRPEQIVGLLAYSSGLISCNEEISLQELLAEFTPEKLCREDFVIALPDL